LTVIFQLIWSAACCSSASVGLFGSSDLLAKNKNGDIVKWSSSAIKWNHWTEASSTESQAPLLRLSELLDVNHFIVSQANSYFIPFVGSHPDPQSDTLFKKVVYIVASEIRHRLFQVSL
jgi:TAG lipase/lysophosphatidylethanolamine acyltransferase